MRKWSELMEENKDVIVKKMVEAYEKAESNMSGWHFDIEMDQDGDVWTSGLLSRGSQSQSSWEGKTFIVVSIDTWVFDYDEMQTLNNNLPECNDIYEAFEQHKIDQDDEYASFRDFMNENYPEKLWQWDDEAKQFEIDSYEEYARDKLRDIIRNQKEYESYKGEDAQF